MAVSVMRRTDGAVPPLIGSISSARLPRRHCTLRRAFKFTGQRQEASLGLYYYGARWRSCRRQPDPALGRFIQADTIVPQPGNPMAWDRYAYTLNNPVRYTDPSGHMFKEDSGGGGGGYITSGCGSNQCYIVLLGSSPSLPYFPTEYISLGENANNSYTGGSVQIPDVGEPGYSIARPSTSDSLSNSMDLLGAINDNLIIFRNAGIEKAEGKIYVYAIYTKDQNGYQLKAIDVQNPNYGAITISTVYLDVKTINIKGTVKSASQSGYLINPSPGIIPTGGGFYNGVGVAQPHTTTTIPLIPSRNPINPINQFSYNQKIELNVFLVDTSTGMSFKPINGYIP